MEARSRMAIIQPSGAPGPLIGKTEGVVRYAYTGRIISRSIHRANQHNNKRQMHARALWAQTGKAYRYVVPEIDKVNWRNNSKFGTNGAAEFMQSITAQRMADLPIVYTRNNQPPPDPLTVLDEILESGPFNLTLMTETMPPLPQHRKQFRTTAPIPDSRNPLPGRLIYTATRPGEEETNDITVEYETVHGAQPQPGSKITITMTAYKRNIPAASYTGMILLTPTDEPDHLVIEYPQLPIPRGGTATGRIRATFASTPIGDPITFNAFENFTTTTLQTPLLNAIDTNFDTTDQLNNRRSATLRAFITAPDGTNLSGAVILPIAG